jgi:hypothetical protein
MKTQIQSRLSLFVTIIAGLILSSTVKAQRASYERPPIDYHNAVVNDPVAELIQDLDSGETVLDYDNKHGYLKSVLEQLDVPVSSQTLVFSKTSMQLHRITPRRPRAVYFNDDVYVGWCQQGEVLELAATDPQQGATFYTIKQTRRATPQITRDRGHCLACHASGRTQNIPGYLVRSVFASRSGQPNLGSGSFTTSDNSPFSERWGGWYVTGSHGQMRHMGNVYFEEDDEQGDRESAANLRSLDELISTRPYLSPHSDLVALMVLEHQTQMHNAITAANYECREVMHQMVHMNKLLEREPDYLSESADRRLNKAAKGVVDHLLMCDEFQLADRVSGTSRFAEEFSSRARQDARGRSLREFDLNQRLFRYPCSYLIHSPAFDALPDLVCVRVVDLLRDVLDGKNVQPEYNHLTTTMRQDILGILNSTKPLLFRN